MPAHRMPTGATPGFGNRISHPHRRTSRRFGPHVQRKRHWPPSESRHVRLRPSARAIRTVDAIGVDAAVARIRARGVRI
ncbi:50S ribosomal protein L28 [Streptomyces sp. bgisy031]|uniref:50S ribosomal protein L28 n=1 Tax=Streptomyces sp. bgisy031 TaxID=3413772 RepID=UPI003D7259D3